MKLKLNPFEEALKLMQEAPNVHRIVIGRHGQTALNREQRVRGWSDVPLDDKGRKEARQTGKELRGIIKGIVCSDLDRARETAEIISEETGAPIWEITREFRPWHLGDFTGEKEEQVRPVLRFYAEEHPDDSLPGGESFNSFKHRLLNGAERAMETYPEMFAIITHHRGDRLMAAWEAKGMPSDHAIAIGKIFERGIPPGSWRYTNPTDILE